MDTTSSHGIAHTIAPASSLAQTPTNTPSSIPYVLGAYVLGRGRHLDSCARESSRNLWVGWLLTQCLLPQRDGLPAVPKRSVHLCEQEQRLNPSRAKHESALRIGECYRWLGKRLRGPRSQ